MDSSVANLLTDPAIYASFPCSPFDNWDGVGSGSSRKLEECTQDRIQLCVKTGSFISRNRTADCRRKGEMEAICCSCLLKHQKTVTQKSGLMTHILFTEVYFGIQQGPSGPKLSFLGYTFKVTFLRQYSQSCAPFSQGCTCITENIVSTDLFTI
jgi:hypothetical protein